MKVKYMMYGKQHQHLFTYDKLSGWWHFQGCWLGLPWMRCDVSHANLSKGTKFDGTRNIGSDDLADLQTGKWV